MHAKPTQHFTMIFNVFVMMTLFNEINARKIHGQRNVFVGLFTNPIYYVIWIATLISQVIEIYIQKKYYKIKFEITSDIGKKTHCIYSEFQVIIVEFGSVAFSTTNLTLEQWAWCIFFGFGTLVWQQLVTSIPTSCIPDSLS